MLTRLKLGGVRKLYFLVMFALVIPHLLLFATSKEKRRITIDARRWLRERSGNIYIDIAYLLVFLPEFRNLFYLRLGKRSLLLRYLPRLSTLYICTPNEKFGEGTVIQHGFATVITA